MVAFESVRSETVQSSYIQYLNAVILPLTRYGINIKHRRTLRRIEYTRETLGT